MSSSSPAPLRVVSLESRQAPDMLRLLTRHGCTGISAPSMREVPLTDQVEAFELGAELARGEHEIIVLLTGVGTRMLVDAMSTQLPREDVIAALGKRVLVCRGPKPVVALKALGLKPQLVAPEPNTWQDLLALLDAQLPVAGRTLVVQAYGRVNEPLLAALRERGAVVRSVGIYAWELPEDLAPLTAAIGAVVRAEIDVVLFTSAQQVEHLYQVAGQTGQEAELTTALRSSVVCASIGPVTTEALVARGLTADLVPEHPKMGHVVLAIARDGRAALARKRAS
ncbi:MAG: uroporphyrinogen-III synthase [Polyangiales bacterium]